MDPQLFGEDKSYANQESDYKLMPIGLVDLELGGKLESVQLAYQTWGELNPTATNAILVCHAISGNSNVVAWWSRLVGPGKAIDTNQYFVICTNVIGGCQGTTATVIEAGNRAVGGHPQVTIGDMVSAQQRLLAELGIERPMLVCGGSMGGMQALEWARRDATASIWMTASCASHSAMQIGINEVARQAIERDPNWKGGYYTDTQPSQGLAVGRMIGHISYLSGTAFEYKFGRNFQNGTECQFQVESYLNHQGNKFTQRFDARSFLILSRAIDHYDCGTLSGSKSRVLLTSFDSDWLYTSAQSEAVLERAIAAGMQARHQVIHHSGGHDAFLLDDAVQAETVRDFLKELDA